jgi:TctA family transporter
VLVLVVGTALGVAPVRLGLRRVPLTGVLLVPILAYFWL